MTGQVPVHTTGTILEDTFYPSHNATDFYHHYKEDIALIGEMGFKWMYSAKDISRNTNEKNLREIILS